MISQTSIKVMPLIHADQHGFRSSLTSAFVMKDFIRENP
jgi:hypothetical protein